MAISIIPQPVEISTREGFFTLTSQTLLDAQNSAGSYFARTIEPALDFSLSQRSAQADDASVIAFQLHAALDLPEDGYLLDVQPQIITLRAKSDTGLFYGVQSLLQLFPTDIFSSDVVQRDWQIPAVSIRDYPRFSWRGFMLDVSRHFHTKETVLQILDQMALLKLNRFHFHLTDDQGWRVEIKKYPRLTEVGAWRSETFIGHPHYAEKREYDGVPHGGFYTQDELRDIVAYAAERHITVIPELEIPGHAQAPIAAYPKLGVTGEQIEVGKTWGIFPHLYNPSEQTLQFLKDVALEMLDIFPSPYFHVGGDEAIKDQWKASPAVQARIKELGLSDEEALQGWFLEQFGIFLEKHDRRLIGWDEILDAPLPAGAIVMSWRGITGGIAAAKKHHQVVMTPTTHVYLDYYQAYDPTEPLGIGGYVPLEKIYSYEPVPDELTEEEAGYILGAQANLWSEYLPKRERLLYQIFPRLLALAEVTWSPKTARDFASFVKRVAAQEPRLSAQGITYRPVALLDQEASYPERVMRKEH